MQKQITFVTYLDVDLNKRVQGIQQELFLKTGSRACIDIWEPHVTVGSEIFIDHDDISALGEKLESAVARTLPFTVPVQGFGFVNDSALANLEGFTKFGIDIGVSIVPKLQQLAETIEGSVTESYELYCPLTQPYRPHLTIAYKDLTEEGFRSGKHMLERESFRAEMTFDHVAMAIRGDDGHYREWKRFPLFVGT